MRVKHETIMSTHWKIDAELKTKFLATWGLIDLQIKGLIERQTNKQYSVETERTRSVVLRGGDSAGYVRVVWVEYYRTGTAAVMLYGKTSKMPFEFREDFDCLLRMHSRLGLVALRRRCEHVSAIAGAIVGEDTLNLDPALLIPGDSAAKECGGGFSTLVWKDFNVSDSRMIVDADVDVVVAAAALLASSIAGDPVADAIDACKLLGVEVKQATCLSVLVANDRRRWSIEKAQASKTCGFDNSSDGRSTAAHMTSDLSAGQPRATELEDLLSRAHAGPSGPAWP